MLTFVLLFLIVLHCGCSDTGAPGEEKPTLALFAAASLHDVISDIGAHFSRTRNVDLVYNFAGSNTLAQQIQASRSADIFLSANLEWVDVLEEADLILPQSRQNFLSNRLVIISRRESVFQIPQPQVLVSLPFSFLALADPDAVPAGRYAKAFLQSIEMEQDSVWDAVKDTIAPTSDVRAVIGIVESDPHIVGMVYRTDVASSDKVKILYEVPPSMRQPITYCAVAMKDRPQQGWAMLFLDFLRSAEAVAICHEHGFIVGE